MKKILSIIFLMFSFLSFAEIKTEKIDIKNGFYNIPAVYTYDTNKKQDSIVIMLHGWASNKDEVLGTYKKLSNNLAKQGIASIRFDFIGTGDSEVDYLHYTLSSTVSDTIKVIEYAKNIGYSKIGLLGWSAGGSIALLSASISNDISSVMTWNGAIDLFENRASEYEKALKDGYYIEEFSWRDPIKVSLQFLKEAKSVNILDKVNEIKVPLLALYGSEDTVVNPKYAQKIVDNSNNKESRVLEIKGSDHIFNLFTNNPLDDKVIEETVKWFKSM